MLIYNRLFCQRSLGMGGPWFGFCPVSGLHTSVSEPADVGEVLGVTVDDNVSSSDGIQSDLDSIRGICHLRYKRCAHTGIY